MQIPSVSWHSSCRSMTQRRNPIQKGGSQQASFPALPTPGLGARLRRGGIRARDRRSCRTMSAPRAFGGLDSLPRLRARGARCPSASTSALDPHEDGPRAPGHYYKISHRCRAQTCWVQHYQLSRASIFHAGSFGPKFLSLQGVLATCY